MLTTTHRPAGALALAVTALAVAPSPGAALSSSKLSPYPADLSPRLGPGSLGEQFSAAVKIRRHHDHPRPARITASGRAVPPSNAPRSVRRIFRAANRIALTPYVWGGGHGSWSASGYDCSGSVGYALHGARLLDSATTSGAFESYGHSGPGRWVTIYANGGHVYMTIAGLRFDTSAHGIGGSRWTRAQRDGGGYVVRHPAGL